MPSPLPNKIKKEAIRLMKENKTNVEISKELGVSTTTLANWRKSSGLPNSTKSVNISGYTDEIKQEAIEQMKEKKTNVEISKQLGVSTTTIANWRKSSGLLNSTNSRNISRYSNEIKQESIQLMKEGKSNKEIKETFGIPSSTIADWRRRAGVKSTSRKPKLELTNDLINDVIDYIREGYTLGEIEKKCGVGRGRVKKIHAEEIASGNLLPDIKLGIARRTKYSDEELIELAFQNPGYGFNRFCQKLKISKEYCFDLFIEFKKFIGDDPFQTLQSTGNHELVKAADYLRITGKKYLPPGFGHGNGNKVKGENRNMHKAVPLPPQDFFWLESDNSGNGHSSA